MYYFLFFFLDKPNLSLCLNLNTTMARAIKTIAIDSYRSWEASICLPCKIINLLNAVIAINKGKEILIDCSSQNTLTIAITSKYRNINNKSANVTVWFKNIVLISSTTAITVLSKIIPNKRSCKFLTRFFTILNITDSKLKIYD